jgi:hypothetical protein
VEPVVYITVEKLKQILENLPGDMKVAMFDDPECDGYYYVQTCKVEDGRLLITNAGCSNANDCEAMDKGGNWWKED